VDALTVATIAAFAACSPSSLPPDVARWEPIVHEASQAFGVPQSWVEHVLDAESRGQTTFGGKPITSSAGAMGLMQIMPQTWGYLRSRYGLGNDPYDSHDNIFAGTALLKELYDRFGYPALFAAYNAGPARLNDFLTSGRVLPAETTAYVARVSGADLTALDAPKQSPVERISRSESSLFFVNAARSDATNPSSPVSSNDGNLFVTLSSDAR
jgi:soluble lytic murein transglycosylase-like protein